VTELVVEQAGSRNVFRNVAASYSGGRNRHLLRQLEAMHDVGRIQVQGSMSAHKPYELEGSIAVNLEPPLSVDAQAKLGGTLIEMRVDGTVRRASARAEVSALVTPFAELPLATAHVRWSDLDAHDFKPALPHTRVAGELALKAQGAQWVGPLRAMNALAGPWDQQRMPVSAISAQLALALPHATLNDLRVELGRAGVLTGSARLGPDSARLQLATSSLDLKGLQTQLRETKLRGHVELALSPDRQTATGVLAQEDIRLAFTANRRGDRVEMPRFVASSRGSELRGAAHLSLAGKRSYGVDATLAGFDPSAWGDFPRGSLNGHITIAGALDAREIRAEYVLQQSRLRGAALSGNGRFVYTPERLSGVDLKLVLGGNSIAARGAFGAEQDRLRLNIDAARLAALDLGVGGAVSGEATLSGSWQSPAAQLDLRGRRLAYGKDVRVDAATVRGSVRQGDPPSADVTLHAEGVYTAAWNAERVDVSAKGTERAHTISARARGGDVDLAVEARGGWRRESGWSGTVSQAKNAGKIPFALAAPVNVAAGPGHVNVGPFAAELLGGRLEVARVRYEQGALDTAGRLADFPVRPLLALAGMPSGPRDTLRLSGQWDIATGADLKVDFSFRRDSGDLVLGAERPLPLGLTTLEAEGRLANERLRFAATVRSALVSAQANGTIGTAGTNSTTGAAVRFTARSPVDLNISAEIEKLATFAGLFETTAVYFDGRASAAASVRGTVGDPIVNGTITGEHLAIALPPQGIDLSGGTLRARLDGRRVEVQQLTFHGGDGTLTAQGMLALQSGERASLDWRADRLRILGRPDRRLVVTGNGRASLDNGKLALSGQLRANEGLFQIGESELPTLGPDVVVVGRPEPAPETPLASRAALDIALDFGNNLHILGRGLDAWIEGRVNLRSTAGGKLVAHGTVSTQRGSYTAFGQKLAIDRGQLLFNGAVDNPGLDIVAMRKNQAVEAGVAVAGTAKSPVVRIVSNPPVPEGEALSWLALGHGPADASRADLATLPLAAAALFGQGKSSQGSIAESLGIDTLSLRGSTTLANNVIAVGKRFSNNLYVIYEQSLGGIANVLKVELNVTRRILLTAEAGATSAAGVVFRWTFD
jgi:translocation and assembly module TamB